MKSFIIVILLIPILRITSIAQWSPFYGPGYTPTALAANSNYFFAGMLNDGIERYNFNTHIWVNTYGADYVRSFLIKGNLVYAAVSGAVLLESTDTGSTWFQILNGNYDNVQKSCDFICLAGNDNYIFLGKNSVPTNYHVIYISSNNGANWFQSDAGIPITENETYVSSILTNGNNIYAASTEGLYYSSSNGFSWIRLGSFANVSSVALTGNYLYAGCYGPNALFRSSNNGVNWEQLTNGLPSNYIIEYFAANGANLFAGIFGNGIYISHDYGNTWISFNEGLNNLIINSILLDNSNLYAGINNYIEKRDISNLISVGHTSTNIPKQFSLSQNYPNPFNPSTIINYQLPTNSNVKLIVYDELGRAVRTLVNEKQNAGSYKVEFDGNNLPSSIYFYKLSAGNFTSVKKMVLIK